MAKKDEIETPPYLSKASSTSISMLRQSVREKADEKWVEATISPLKEDITEIKKIALSAKKRAMEPHGCNQEQAIKDIKKTMNGWKNIKIGAVISVVVLSSAVIAQFFALKNGVQNNQTAITDVQEDLSHVNGVVVEARIEVQEVKAIVEDEQKTKVKQDKKQIQEIKSAIKEAFDSSRRRR